jgi:hypothetical protein
MPNDFTKRWAVLDDESLRESKQRGLAALAAAEASMNELAARRNSSQALLRIHCVTLPWPSSNSMLVVRGTHGEAQTWMMERGRSSSASAKATTDEVRTSLLTEARPRVRPSANNARIAGSLGGRPAPGEPFTGTHEARCAIGGSSLICSVTLTLGPVNDRESAWEQLGCLNTAVVSGTLIGLKGSYETGCNLRSEYFHSPAMKSYMIFAAAMLAACTDAATSPPIVSHGVMITIAVPGRCLVGACDQVSADFSHLGLVTIRNAGATTAYLHRCGPGPALAEQQFVKGQWVMFGPAISCPVTPGPLTLAPGDSLQSNWFFWAGEWRMTLGVASQASMSDETLDASASIGIK